MNSKRIIHFDLQSLFEEDCFGELSSVLEWTDSNKVIRRWECCHCGVEFTEQEVIDAALSKEEDIRSKIEDF